jgi:hypothetical protein
MHICSMCVLLSPPSCKKANNALSTWAFLVAPLLAMTCRLVRTTGALAGFGRGERCVMEGAQHQQGHALTIRELASGTEK